MKEYIVKDMTGEFEDKDYPELIRCKDCKKFVTEEDQAYCLDMYGQCDENGFCAWAERKEE